MSGAASRGAAGTPSPRSPFSGGEREAAPRCERATRARPLAVAVHEGQKPRSGSACTLTRPVRGKLLFSAASPKPAPESSMPRCREHAANL
eukprot:6209090-Pleurochrysis_carterae.AAC.1